jgi:lysozyme
MEVKMASRPTQTSQAGVARISEREGFRLVAYPDTRGLWTIGVGHLSNDYFPVTPGLTITRKKALELLAHDLKEVENTINACVCVDLTQNQFDALASLGFNIGCAGLAHSSVIHRLNAGDYQGAAAAFMMWVHPPELTNRRAGEMQQFLGHTGA